MSKSYRLICCDCKEEWIGNPYDMDYETLCPECKSDDVWIGAEYVAFRIESLWVVLLIPNILLCMEWL